jgi:hypothetical protein
MADKPADTTTDELEQEELDGEVWTLPKQWL